AEIQLGRRLVGLKLAADQVSGLSFSDGDVALQTGEAVILAVPPWIAQDLLPSLTVPDAFCAIVNPPFKGVPPAGPPRVRGVIGAPAEWFSASAARLSVTVSAADPLVDQDNDTLARLLWRDVATAHGLPMALPTCRIVKEKRATFAATPAQERRRP